MWNKTIVRDAVGGAYIVRRDRRSVGTSSWDLYAHKTFDAGLIFGDGLESGDTGE
jgi:hypothetical protein